jgi:hypothetical protein
LCFTDRVCTDARRFYVSDLYGFTLTVFSVPFEFNSSYTFFLNPILLNFRLEKMEARAIKTGLHLIPSLVDALNAKYLKVILCVRTHKILSPCELLCELHEPLFLAARTGCSRLTVFSTVSCPFNFAGEKSR